MNINQASKEGTTFWTSDIHFGHRNIIKYCDRPFEDVPSMDERIIRNWNETVMPWDTVMVLGDVALGGIAESLPKVARLNGNLFLVPGNHDRCWSGDRRAEKWIEKYENVGFNILAEGFRTVVGGHDVNVSHFPYEGDSHGEDRYSEYRMADTSLPIIHGHVHDAWRINGNQFNVGMDVHNFRPVAEFVIVEWLDGLA